MADTSWLDIRLRTRDLPKFNEVLKNRMCEGAWWNEDNSIGDDGFLVLTVSEAEHSWGDEIKVLKDAGLSFTTAHGHGDDYGPCVFACHKGEGVECSADWDSNPVVPVRNSGMDEEACKACRRYWELVQQFEEEPEIT